MREIDYTPELHYELPLLSGNRYFLDNTFLDGVRRETLKIEQSYVCFWIISTFPKLDCFQNVKKIVFQQLSEIETRLLTIFSSHDLIKKIRYSKIWEQFYRKEIYLLFSERTTLEAQSSVARSIQFSVTEISLSKEKKFCFWTKESNTQFDFLIIISIDFFVSDYHELLYRRYYV